MPSKDALRELQLRLASRLQAARERPRESGWLAVECAQVGLLLPLAQAGEIHAARQVAPVPHAKPWMLGVANLRGQLNAVVDLGQFLHLRPAAAGAIRSGAQFVMSGRVAGFRPTRTHGGRRPCSAGFRRFALARPARP